MTPIQSNFIEYPLDFKFRAGTSRGVLEQKPGYIIRLALGSNPDIYGLGECSIIPGLSPEDPATIKSVIEDLLPKITDVPGKDTDILALVADLVPASLPALRMALEMAMLDLAHGGKRQIFADFDMNKAATIPINGLIWMGDMDDMLRQVNEKVSQGFKVIKIKIGAMHFEKECDMLDYIRKKFYKEGITLRLDANGAFKPEEALGKLQYLSRFDIHSIEQPIKAGQKEHMARLCRESPIPIALDEELIGVHGPDQKKALLEATKPPYIILKPSLMGGISGTLEWIQIAENLKIQWWLTSALESNIGLNAIAQMAAVRQVILPQGLGTGQLFHNNVESPWVTGPGTIHYEPALPWDFSGLVFRS